MKTHLSLSISYLNIHGLHNTLGCKISDLDEFLINDINVFAETWTCNHDKNVPDFEHIAIEPNKLNKNKKGRSSGGLLIYYKSHLKNHLSVIKKCKNHIWIDIDKNIFHDTNSNAKVCFTYIPPQDSPYYSDNIYEEIAEDILEFTTENEDVLIVGDFNARTHLLRDNIPETKHSSSDANQLNTINQNYFIPRNNCDTAAPN